MADMPKTTVRDGQTLCGIAYDAGFRNCKKVRDANPTLATREIKPGDEVQLPAVTPKEETGATDTRHKFKRLGAPPGRVWFIQHRNVAKPQDSLSHVQRRLAVSNYVTGRQGSGFATQEWVDKTVFNFTDAASQDPDHFKMLVFDKHAKDRGDTEVKLTLQVERPRLTPEGKIQAWEDLADPGAKLENVVCKQVEADSPWYRGYYMRLVAERDDQNNRQTDNVDTGKDRTDQTLVVTAPSDDRRVEVLDERVKAFRDAEDCGATGTQPKCRAIARADVGKDELALRILVLRVNGAGNQAALTTEDQIRNTLLPNIRLQLAQINVGLKVLGVRDIPLPRNMIAVGDDNVVKASGDKEIGATVNLTSGNVTATIRTKKKEKPEQTARRLAAALVKQGVKCRVSPNPAPINAGIDFGPCDILCFNADDTLARVMAVTNDAGENQKLSHTGRWGHTASGMITAATTGSQQYGGNEPKFRFIGSRDYRALLKNNYQGATVFHAYVINSFNHTSAGLLGYALIPYREVTAKHRPLPEFTMGVLVNNNAALRRTVLTHEAGHAFLDAIHTSKGLTTAPDQDHQGNTDNRRLGFSEMMTAFDSSMSGGTPQPFLHKRLSDAPLQNEFMIVHGNLEVRYETFGSGTSKPTAQRFRTLFGSLFEPLRPLLPAPGSNL